MSARECDCRAEHHSGIHIPRCAIYAGPPPDHDDALWTDLMSAMTGVLGSDDEAIDLSTDLLEAIRPHIDREVRDAETLAKVREIVDELGEPNPSTGHIIRCANACGDIARLLADTGNSADDSDIMPGSEFDGPVIL